MDISRKRYFEVNSHFPKKKEKLEKKAFGIDTQFNWWIRVREPITFRLEKIAYCTNYSFILRLNELARVGGRAILLLRNPWEAILSTWHHQLTNSWDGDLGADLALTNPEAYARDNLPHFRR